MLLCFIIKLSLRRQNSDSTRTVMLLSIQPQRKYREIVCSSNCCCCCCYLPHTDELLLISEALKQQISMTPSPLDLGDTRFLPSLKHKHALCCPSVTHLRQQLKKRKKLCTEHPDKTKFSELVCQSIKFFQTRQRKFFKPPKRCSTITKKPFKINH